MCVRACVWMNVRMLEVFLVHSFPSLYVEGKWQDHGGCPSPLQVIQNFSQCGTLSLSRYNFPHFGEPEGHCFKHWIREPEGKLPEIRIKLIVTTLVYFADGSRTGNWWKISRLPESFQNRQFWSKTIKATCFTVIFFLVGSLLEK